MADVYDYIGLSGLIVADTQDIQAEVEAEFQTAFGADLIITPDTPQGVLITAETLARAAVADNNAQVANQINPDIAGGIFLDALLQLLGSRRVLGTSTIVAVTFTGSSGITVPEGTLIMDSVYGEVFATQSYVTLTGSGGVFIGTVNAASVNYGAFVINPGTLTLLVAPIEPNLETATNTSQQSVIGALGQTDEQASIYRRMTLAASASSLSEAITSAVYAVPNVLSLKFQENDADTTVTINGVAMLPHSIYICVYGGADTAVAVAIDSKKSGGCNYTNAASGATPVTINVTDPYSGQVKAVSFDRPAVTGVLVQVTVVSNPEIQNPLALIQQAISDYANGLLSQEPGLTVGTGVSAFELAGAINREVPGIYVKNLLISYASGTPSFVTYLPITIAQVAQINSSNISVTVVSS